MSATAAVNGAVGFGMAFTAITTVTTSVNQIVQGWNQVRLKLADMTAQIPATVTIPPVVNN